jgi:hypothetical protein
MEIAIVLCDATTSYVEIHSMRRTEYSCPATIDPMDFMPARSNDGKSGHFHDAAQGAARSRGPFTDLASA